MSEFGMTTADRASIVPKRSLTQGFMRPWFLWIAVGFLVGPTFAQLARELWSTEPGGHGPIVFATGLWLLARARHDVAALARPGLTWLAAIVLTVALLGYVVGRITGLLEIESYSAYGALLAIAYYHIGSAAMRKLWFPLVYIAFMLPTPETLILPLSQVLKLGISSSAVWLLAALDYPVGKGGVVIFVGQYELLIAQACSGLNSLIGLGAIGLLYAYIRYDGSWSRSLPLLVLIPPIALIANFIRVVILILVTYYFGNRVADTYIHNAAGIVLFSVAVAMMLTADRLIEHVRAMRQ